MEHNAEKVLEDNFVPDFYEDTEIFITGGSGVVGKAVIEKLLRSCNVRRIYVLLRTKRDKPIKDRLQQIIEAKIFRTLKKIKPDELDKLIPVPGDAILPNLGITPEYAELMQNVSIVFHCAATIRFDEPLKEALRLNVGGTWEAVKFAETLKKLKVFMHVSTFFSNPYLHYVENKIYESPMDWKLCMRLIEDDIDSDLLDNLTRKMIVGFPNTYTFTKNIAESLVNSYCNRLPVIIYRPSIVIFALEEPEPGFPTSMTGAMGLFVLLYAGMLKMVFIDPEAKLDLTPMDLCVKTMCYYAARGAKVYENHKTQNLHLKSTPVYLFSSYLLFPWNFQRMVEFVQEEKVCEATPFENILLYPYARFTKYRTYYYIGVLIMQVLPAMMADFLIKMFGHKPVAMGIMRKMYISLEVMDPFRFNTWASSGITEYDIIRRDLKNTEWDIVAIEGTLTREGVIESSKKMCATVRDVLLKQDPSSIPKSYRKLKIKEMISNIIYVGFIYFCICLVYKYIFKSYVKQIF